MIKTRSENINATTAIPMNTITEPPLIKRIRGFRSQYNGIDAVADPDNGEILRTYDPDSGELLLDFSSGVFPADLERYYTDVYFARDFSMEFQHDGTPSSVQACAEKMVAYAVMRDILGLPCGDLVISDTEGTCRSSGRFLCPEHTVLLALSGVAWAARNGIMPTAAELVFPNRILSETCFVDKTHDRATLPVSETFKWRMSEAVQELSRYSKMIRMIGRVLGGSGYVSAFELEFFLRNKRYLAAGPERPLDPSTPQQLVA